MHSKNFQLSFKNHNFTDYLGFYALKETNMARKAQNKKKYTFIVEPRANRSHIKHAIEELFDLLQT